MFSIFAVMAAEGEQKDEDFLQEIKDIARYEFEDILREMDGPKDLVIQPELMSLMEHVTPVKFLRSKRVDRMFRLESPSDEGGDNRFFVIRPELLSVKQTLLFIEEDRRSHKQRNNAIIYVPRTSYACEHLMEQNGIHGLVKIHEWHLNLIPLDTDFLSLEITSAFYSLYVDQDLSCLHTVATSILNFQRSYGSIPSVHAIGELSHNVYRLMNNLKETGPTYEIPPRNEVSDLILFDRRTDFVTPLCSQLTYEGILDDVFGIKAGFVQFDSSVTDRTKAVKVMVNSSDPVFKIIRSQHFSVANVSLGRIARELDSDYKEGKDPMQTVSEIKEFVKRMPELKTKHQSLSVHVKASEKIVDIKTAGDVQKQLQIERALIENYDGKEVLEYIDESILGQMQTSFMLRLISLMSCAFGGVKSKQYQRYKQMILQTNGYKHLTSFYNLKKCGLLQEQGTSSKGASFRQLCRKLNLIPKTSNVEQPTDTSFVFGGIYKPLSCAIINTLLNKKDLSSLEGIDRVTYQQGASVRPSSTSSSKGSKRKVLVYFIGGCSLSELNALRFIGQKTSISFIVATTHVINGNSLIESVMV